MSDREESAVRSPPEARNPLRTLPEFLERVQRIVAAAAALAGGLLALWAQIGESGEEQRRWLVVALVLVGLAAVLWAAGRWFALRSTLRRPSALDIGREYLRGRDQDLENLLGRLRDFPLVWLVGESGAGKSSLLRLGLVPRLGEDRSSLPVLVDHWGTDWVTGPEQALGRALADALAEGSDEAPDDEIGSAPGGDGDSAFHVLDRLRDERGLQPVLIFDQFDDYQTRHRDRFVVGAERKILGHDELTRANPFWRRVADLLERDRVRCLVVTRTDMQWGLESVRFREPELYVLGRLGREHAAELLDEITAGDVVRRPELGWERLRRRLLQDLGADGWVLPIRMKLVFRGLEGLRTLSVSHYEAEGGLTGLEALDLRKHIHAAARDAGWPPGHVRKVLLELADPESGVESGGKTVPRTADRLLEVVPEADRDAEHLDRALRRLEDAEIVRRRIDRDRPESTAWVLDHDYLCAAVLELHRRAHRWQARLDEAVRRFEGARGILARWRGLMRPGLQLRLLAERLRGRLRYGRGRWLAALSGVRLVVNAWVLMLAVAGYLWIDFGIERRARELFTPFDLDESTSGAEAAALWELSREGRRVRAALFDGVFADRTNVARFAAHGERIRHAAFGLPEPSRQRELAEIVEEHCYLPDQPDWGPACPALLAGLRRDPAVPAAGHALDVVSERLVEGIAQAEVQDELPSVLAGLEALGNNLTAGAAEHAANRFLARLETTSASDEVELLTRGLAVIAEPMSQATAHRVADRLVTRIARDWSTESLMQIALRIARASKTGSGGAMAALRAVGPQLSQTAADRLAKRLVDLVEKVVPPESADKQRGPLSRWFFGRTAEIETWVRVGKLARGFEVLRGPRQPDTAERAVERLLGLVEGSKSGPTREGADLAEVMKPLARDLEREVADRYVNRILDSMKRAQDPGESVFWAVALGGLGSHASGGAADQAAEVVLKAMEPSTMSSESGRSTLMKDLSLLGPHLSAEGAGRVATRMVSWESWELNTWAPFGPGPGVDGWIRVFETVAWSLEKETVERAWYDVFRLMRLQSFAEGPSDLDRVLRSIGARLAPEVAEGAAQQLLALHDSPRDYGGGDRFLFRLWASVLPGVAQNLPRKAAEDAADRILKLMEGAQAGFDPTDLLRSFAALGPRLGDPAAERVRVALFHAMHPMPEPPCEAAAPLMRRGNLDRFVELLKWPTCSDEARGTILRRLAEVTGEPFGDGEVAGGEEGGVDFVDWAATAGHDLGSPPEAP